MCGVLGGITTKQFEPMICQNALEKLHHRGPDYQKIKFYKKNDLFFAHSRLKIIDLSNNANQPMVSSCNNYEITFNGEIYNFQELKLKCKNYDFRTKSDTEVLLALFKIYGKDMLDMLEGMFVFAIYDKINNSIFIARDRFGIKQLYYFIEDNTFVFSSEIPPLLSFKQDIKEDLRTIKTYLSTSFYDFSQHTFFKDINRLEPGCYLEFKIATFTYTIKKWYALEKNIILNRKSKEQLFQEMEELLFNLIKKVLKIKILSSLDGIFSLRILRVLFLFLLRQLSTNSPAL